MGALDSENPRHSNQKKDTNHSTEDKCMVSVIFGLTLFKLDLRSKLQPIV
jgi:hypothetical protein